MIMPKMKDKTARGLHGQDMRQGDLRDTRGGTFGDKDARGRAEDPPPQEQRTPRRHAQAGADVRSEAVQIAEALPEGLVRERKGPLNKRSGRR
jgi:hypothetical protein